MTAPSTVERYAGPRRILPGYPAAPFTSVEDVEGHLSGDRITCLLCGKSYKLVVVHIARIHDLQVPEYRQRFNIPARYSLSGETTRELKRAHYETVAGKMLEGNLERIARRKKPIRRLVTKLGAEARTQNLADVEHERKYGDDYSWHLEQVRTVFAFRQVAVPNGLPSWRTIKRRRAEDPSLNKLFLDAAAERPRA